MYHFHEYKITLKTFHLELRSLNLEPEDHEHIVKVARSATYHKFLDFVLEELEEEHHKRNLLELIQLREDAEKIFNFLEEVIEDLNNKIEEQERIYERELLNLLQE